MNEDTIRAKIEGLMGWKRGGSLSFSMRALQSFVRGKDPIFDEQLASYLDQGEHFFVKDDCPHGNKAGECNACDVQSDLAYDAAREMSRRSF
jgi:hypothetical protein